MLRDSSGTWVVKRPVAGQPSARDWGRGFNEVSDYAQAADGSLYYVVSSSYYSPGSGEIHRITYRASTLDAPAEPAQPARLSLRPQPSLVSAGPVRLAYTLAGAEPATLQLFDIAGRSVARTALPVGQRSGVAALGDAALLAPGVYRAALSQGNRRVTSQVVITH